MIVDMREFRSKLPSLLYQANYDICPSAVPFHPYTCSLASSHASMAQVSQWRVSLD